jgi:hypothetical protein
MFGMSEGYTFCAIVIIFWALAYMVTQVAAAWRARALAREETRRVELKASAERAKHESRLVAGWVPPEPKGKK